MEDGDIKCYKIYICKKAAQPVMCVYQSTFSYFNTILVLIKF